MVGKLILRGLIAGILAGLLAFGFARFFGEPAVNTAVNFESQQEEAHEQAAAAAAAAQGTAAPAAHDHDEEIFSRSVQGGIGLLTGVVVVGAGLGALFAVLFAFANGRIGAWGPGATSALLAALGWVSLYLVPALKYPANPPSVGQPDTIRLRTGLYFLMMAISIATTFGAWMLASRVARTRGPWNGFLAGFIVYLVVLGIFFQVLPAVSEVPINFPAVTLWDFRIASAGLQAVLWGGVAIIFGTIAEWSQGNDHLRRAA